MKALNPLTYYKLQTMKKQSQMDSYHEWNIKQAQGWFKFEFELL